MFKTLVSAKLTDEDEARILFDEPERSSSADIFSRLEEESKMHLSNIFGNDYHVEDGAEYVDGEHGKYYLVG